MNIADFAREIRELYAYADETDWGRSLPVPSCQSFHQAQIEARAKMQRHRYFTISDGRRAPVPIAGTDLRCGCTVHRSGRTSDHGRRPEEASAINPGLERAVIEEAPIRLALQRADDSVPYLLTDDRRPAWTHPALPEKVLRHCFREPLTPEMAMFDPAAQRVYNTVKMVGSSRKLDRARVALAAEAARSKQERGPGNLAPYTAAMREEFGDVPEREMIRLVVSMGKRLSRPVASARERDVQRETAFQVELLQLHGLAVYRRSHSRLRVMPRRAVGL